MSTSHQPNILCLMEKQHRHLFVGVHHVNREYIYLFLALADRWFAWFGSLTWVGAHVGQACDQLGGCFPLFTDWTSEQKKYLLFRNDRPDFNGHQGATTLSAKRFGSAYSHLLSTVYNDLSLPFKWLKVLNEPQTLQQKHLSQLREKEHKMTKNWRQVFCDQSKV